MIERGELTVTIEDREYTGKTGDLFFVNPGFSIPCTPGREKTLSTTPLYSIPRSCPSRCTTMYRAIISRLCFPAGCASPKSWKKRGLNSPLSSRCSGMFWHPMSTVMPDISLKPSSPCCPAFMTMYRENLFITESERSRKTSPEQVARSRISCPIIRDHYQEKILLEDIAAYLHLSPKYFSGISKNSSAVPSRNM